ncbi:C-C chemokine receptor type 2-like isoform X2 [Echeneis naucrates]|nr:C-C chemokine receptor type 2-like isoform X2 [Echeneis naucrates]
MGNGVVVCVLVKHRKQTNMTDICLFNLALADLLFVLTLPFYAHFSAVSQWTMGDFFCRFITCCQQIGFLSSIFFMIAMTLDRYTVILHTHKAAWYRTLESTVIMSILVWIVSICLSVPASFYTTVKNASETLVCARSQENHAWNLYHIFLANVLGLIVPMLVMVSCYCRIVPVVMNMKTAKKHRAVRLIIFLVAIFFLLWSPYNICIFLLFLQCQEKLPNDCSFDTNLKFSVIVTEVLAYTHCCLNPVIYAFFGHRFMKRVVKMLCEWASVIHSGFGRDFPASIRRRSVSSRSSEVESTIIM